MNARYRRKISRLVKQDGEEWVPGARRESGLVMVRGRNLRVPGSSSCGSVNPSVFM